MHINNLNIVPDWRLEDIDGNLLHVKLLPLLRSIYQCGKLTKAADECKLSYRHAWNILQETETFFGQPVAAKQQGRGAQLTPLGEVLLRADQRIEARLHTQMESLTMELNGEMHRVLADQIKTLSIYASHGYAVALVPKFLSTYQAEIHYHGPEDSLRALRSGACKIAGFHLPLHQRIVSQQHRYQSLLGSGDIKVLRFIKRQQGLMMTKDNATKISSLKALTKQNIRFVNRQPRSGTRELFDQVLLEAGIEPTMINGYDNHEYTHSAVAAHVATGMADVGFGVQAAAARCDLAFLPVTEDLYFWAYVDRPGDQAEIEAFFDVLRSEDFQIKVNELPGYECDRCGELADINDLLD